VLEHMLAVSSTTQPMAQQRALCVGRPAAAVATGDLNTRTCAQPSLSAAGSPCRQMSVEAIR
jgi:hypothetical protein